MKSGFLCTAVGFVVLGFIDRIRELLGTAQAGDERVEKEARNREQLRAGALGLDLYGLRARLAALGVRYVDELKPPPIRGDRA